jgi:fucose permease
MVGQDYALATTTFWIGLIVGEIPANRLIQILPLGKYLSGSVCLWAVCLMAMAFAKDAP